MAAINTIGIRLSENSDYCVGVPLNTGSSHWVLYLHGTTDEVRAFAAQITAAADEHDRAHKPETVSDSPRSATLAALPVS